MHTWNKDESTSMLNESGIQNFLEYRIVNPDFYKKDNDYDFINSINIDDYFYKDVWNTKGHGYDGEWLPHLVSNHLCQLESQRRGLSMIKDFVDQGNTFKYVIIMRQDIFINIDLPIHDIISKPDAISIPNFDHFEGYNDRFAIMNYENSFIYGNRIKELKDYRKTQGRIVAEKCLRYVLDSNNIEINMIPFYFDIVRI
jgi:hypothetical protein